MTSQTECTSRPDDKLKQCRSKTGPQQEEEEGIRHWMHKDSSQCVEAFMDYFTKQLAKKESIQVELETEKDALLQKENSLLANLAALTSTQAELLNIQKAKDEEIREKDEALKQTQKLLAEAEGVVASQKQVLADLQRKLDDVHAYVKKMELPRWQLSPEQREALDKRFVNAVSANNVDEVKRLVDKGAEVNAKVTFDDKCALHIASRKGFQAIVEVLIAKGAEANAQDRCGATPLLLAASSGMVPIVKALLDAGARTDIQGREEISMTSPMSTPLKAALRRGHTDTANLISLASEKKA